MSKPAKLFNAAALQQAINRQSWLILALVMIGITLDILLQQSDFAVSKNLLAGSILAWLGQFVFAKISLSRAGYHQRRQVVNRLYQAHMIKWLITIIGFAMIFVLLKPLKALVVFVGFIVLQMSYIYLTYRHHSVK